MSEKDKVKFIKITPFEKKFLMAEQAEFNDMMNSFATKLQAFWDKLRKARIEEFSIELGIEEAYQEGEWAFDTGKSYFVKQNKVTPPPPPPDPPIDLKDPKKETPGRKTH